VNEFEKMPSLSGFAFEEVEHLKEAAEVEDLLTAECVLRHLQNLQIIPMSKWQDGNPSDHDYSVYFVNPKKRGDVRLQIIKRKKKYFIPLEPGNQGIGTGLRGRVAELAGFGLWVTVLGKLVRKVLKTPAKPLIAHTLRESA